MPLPLSGDRTLVTGDADLAARWLSKKLGQEVPTVSLALAGAPLVQAQAEGDTGTLLFRSAQGIPLALHIFLHARIDAKRTRSVPYEGDVYQVATVGGAPNTLVSWQSDGCAFAAVAPLSQQELLPYAHEMSRRCLPGH